MERPAKIFKASAVPQTTIRRLRVMPSYFFLIWRWSMWLYALAVILFSFLPDNRNSVSFRADSGHLTYEQTALLLLSITFIETMIVTLYAPVIHILLPRLMRKPGWLVHQSLRQRHDDMDGAEIVPPLTPTRNHYWDIAIYGADVLICGLVMYYSGPFSNPPFGLGSPFYRYGMSTVFAAAIAYRYRGGLLAAIVYSLFALLGVLVPAPGAVEYHVKTLVDVAGSMVDTPLAAILVAYLASLLDSYAQSKRREQENARTQQYLVRVGETLLKSAHDRQELLKRSITPIQKGGHFQRLIIALIDNHSDEEAPPHTKPEISALVEANHLTIPLPDQSKTLIEQVLRTGDYYQHFEPQTRLAQLYVPFRKNGEISLIVGAECQRSTPFNPKHEAFLTIACNELLVALENIRLAEQTVQLAALAERSRIAREIHDGIAQLTYMLSLHAETCHTQAQRIEEASEEDTELIRPLTQRLEKLVTVSKQALWETRNYMFSLKPLISGNTTLSQMLSTQVREFEAISDLHTHFVLEGLEKPLDSGPLQTRRYAQIGANLFRIVQEALTNAYKHAQATRVQVTLRYTAETIEVEIVDNGRGLPQLAYSTTGQYASEESARIYSGHGLKGMLERAVESGGTVEIKTVEAGGVLVHACIPIGAKGALDG